MNQQKSPLSQIIAQLRDVLRSTRYSMMADVLPLVEQAYVLLGFEDQNAPATDVNRSDLAFNIAVMLEHTQDNSVIRVCLGMLLHIKGIGEILAATYLRKNKVPRQTLLTTLNGFEPVRKLSLADRFFRHPHKHEPWFLEWAHEIAKEIQGEDPEEVLLFLENMHESEGRLSNPLQRELLRGRFGVWLHRLLHLELDEEQLGFMLETTRRLGSHQIALSLLRSLTRADGAMLARLLVCIGECGRKQDATLINRVLPFVRNDDPAVCLAALAAMGKLQAEKLPHALAWAWTRQEGLRNRLLPLLLRMNATGLRIFFERLPKVERLELLPRLVALFTTFNPVWMVEALQLQAKIGQGQDKDSRQLLKIMEDFLLAHQPVARESGYRPTSAPRDSRGETTRRASKEQEKAAFALLEKLKGSVSGIAKPAEDAGSGRTLHGDALVRKLAQGGRIERIVMEGQEQPGLRVTDAELIRCTLGTNNVTESYFKNVRFEKCVLRNVDLAGSTFEGVVFLDCELTNCRMASCRTQNVTLHGCTVNAGQFSNSMHEELTFSTTKLTECDFSGSRMDELIMQACLLHSVHFAHVDAREPEFLGVEFVDCRFQKTSMDRGFMRNSSASTSVFTDCRFYDMDTDEPGFLGQGRKTAVEGMAAVAKGVRPARMAPQLGSAAGMRLMFRLIEQWYYEKDLKEREALFLENNRRRLDWAYCMLPGASDAFLRMLPSLVESPGPLPGPRQAPEQEDEPAWPPCAIHGYAPDWSVLQMLVDSRIPPGPQGEAERDAAIPIEGLYTIGSTGTIAHARFSDVDLWVCYDPALVSPENVTTLQSKLERIEKWAQKNMNVEVHFFLMDLESVRENEFGFTDKESAGSSQAQLLKEEFYRTGVYVAGKKPVWWYLPVGVDAKGYKRVIQRFQDAVGPLDRSVLDLGHLEEIPKGEFFGASLWQIVKAIKSPFKSAMKLALLDKYISGMSTNVLLCNRVKHNLFLGAKDLWDIDPYALMFREVFEYYAENDDTDAQDLMRLAFLQKTGLYLAAQSTGRFYEMQDYSYMEFFFPYSEAEIASHVEPGRGVLTEEIKVAQTYGELVALGQLMVRFMLKTYERIHTLWSRLDIDTRVTEEDMTKLGRKILSYLNPRPGKIMRLPFMAEAGGARKLFASLEFTCEGLAGTATTWICLGEAPKSKGKRSKKEEIRRAKELVPMLVWLVANKAFSSGKPLQGANLEYPVSLGDISDLLEFLCDFLPLEKVFDSDINEYLRQEEIAYALCVVNFMTPREEREIREVTLVYATNWGELYCQKVTANLKQLRNHPQSFLRTSLGKGLHHDLQFSVYLPPKSMCPKIRMF